MVAPGRPGRVDPGRQRGGSHHARVRPDQGAQAPVQHSPRRRQELPLVGRDPGRTNGPGPSVVRGRRRPGTPLLRPLCPRRGPSGDTLDLLAAVVPGADVLGPQARPAREAGPTLPALPHRTVLGALHRGGGPANRATTPWWPTSWRSPRRRHRRTGRGTPGGRDDAGGRRPRLRTGGPTARTSPPATLRMAVERQEMVTDRSEDLDVVGIQDDALEAAVYVFRVRRGRVVGRRAFVVDKVGGACRRPSWWARSWNSSTGTPSPWPARAGAPPGCGGATARGGRRGRGIPGRWGTDGGHRWPPGVPRQVLVPDLPDDVRGVRGLPGRPARRPRSTSGYRSGAANAG